MTTPSSLRRRLVRGSKMLLLLTFINHHHQVLASSIPCNTTKECEEHYRVGSVCQYQNDDATETTCSNPYERGCLHTSLPELFPQPRVCNSEDPPNAAAELGLCRVPDLEYMEIRIYSQNWESVFFVSWILQILLSELLDIPTTIETGTYDTNLNLYDPASPFDYGGSNDFNATTTATKLVDCRLASKTQDRYEPCAHIIPEVWDARYDVMLQLANLGLLELPQALGVLGQQSWFIPKFTANADPSLTHYLGLAGEANRRKLAETFLRPTSWLDYCNQVSSNNCSTPDGVAARAPLDATTEGGLFFAGHDLYIGHFRKTPAGDCDLNPTTCTGHIADYPCDWTSYNVPQRHWLEIHVTSDGPDPSGGYSYSQLLQLWAAANATKSHLMVMWWTPDILFHEYLGTDAEMHRVSLLPPTQECVQNRIPPDARCSDNITVQLGDPRGGCDEVVQPLSKATSMAVYKNTFEDESIPTARRSPSWEALQLFSISALQVGEMFDKWLTRKHSPREAVCDWVVANLDFVREFVPRTHPRALQRDEDLALLYAAVALGAVATLMTMWAAVTVIRHRRRRIIVFAQIEFLWLLLAGLLLISVGSVVVAAPASDGSCIASIWLVNLGYTTELIPLIVKVAAINRLMHAAQHMRRVVLRRQSLFGAVACIMALVVVFLACWTKLDPPQQATQYELTERTNEKGHTIVMERIACASSILYWNYAAISWTALLLVCATVLAFQTRKLRQDFNESQTLAIMIYSHFVFVLLRVITFFLTNSVSWSLLTRCQSILLSCDVIGTIGIYFIPKFATPEDASTPGFTTTHPVYRWIANLSHITTMEATATDQDAAAAAYDKYEGKSAASSDCMMASNSQRSTEALRQIRVQHQAQQQSAADAATSPEDPSTCDHGGITDDAYDGEDEVMRGELVRCLRCGHVQLASKDDDEDSFKGDDDEPAQQPPILMVAGGAATLSDDKKRWTSESITSATTLPSELECCDSSLGEHEEKRPGYNGAAVASIDDQFEEILEKIPETSLSVSAAALGNSQSLVAQFMEDVSEEILQVEQTERPATAVVSSGLAYPPAEQDAAASTYRDDESSVTPTSSPSPLPTMNPTRRAAPPPTPTTTPPPETQDDGEAGDDDDVEPPSNESAKEDRKPLPLLDPQTMRSFSVPPGTPGLVIEEQQQTGLVVAAVEESSLLHGLVCPGDIIVRFGGVDTRTMGIEALGNLINHTLYRNKTITVCSLPSSAVHSANA